MIKRHPFRFTVVIFFLIFCGLYVTVNLFFGKENSKFLTEQMLHREQVIVRSGAKSINSFVDLSTRSLMILAQDEAIVNEGVRAQITLERMVAEWKGTPLSLVAVVDTKGNIVAAASNQDKIVDLNFKVVNRDYFREGLKLAANNFFVGQPILPGLNGLQKKYLVPISIPIYRQDKNVGILVATFYLSDIANDYLEPLRISDQTGIVLVNQRGIILSSNFEETINRSIFDYIRSFPFLGDKVVTSLLREKLESDKEQKLTVAIPDFKTGKLTATLIAASPLTVGGNKWFLAITVPMHEALVFVSPFLWRSLLTAFFVYIVTVTVVVYIFRKIYQ